MRRVGPLSFAIAIVTWSFGVRADAEILLDVGLGPAAYFFNGLVGADQAPHYGVVLNTSAIIDKETIKANSGRIPSQYREAAQHMHEVRFSPSIFIPHSFFISPRSDNTAIYGVTWRPVGAGLLITQSPIRTQVGLGLLLSYAYIDSVAFSSPTHFLRPGLDVNLDFELPITKHFLVSAGWGSGFYVPQELGGFGISSSDQDPDWDESIWHIGRAYCALHVRFPYEAQL